MKKKIKTTTITICSLAIVLALIFSVAVMKSYQPRFYEDEKTGGVHSRFVSAAFWDNEEDYNEYDFNGNSAVDEDDMVYLLGILNMEDEYSDLDFNGDAIVDEADLGLLISVLDDAGVEFDVDLQGDSRHVYVEDDNGYSYTKTRGFEDYDYNTNYSPEWEQDYQADQLSDEVVEDDFEKELLELWLESNAENQNLKNRFGYNRFNNKLSDPLRQKIIWELLLN